MKTKLILSSMLFATMAFAQIPNNGFEMWTNQGSYNTPDNWGNLNPLTSAASVYTCTKGTPGSVGASYIKLTSKTVAGLGVVPGVAVSGTINTSSFTAGSGFPFNGQPVSLKGKWQHMASGTDEGFISVYLTKWNTGTNSRDTVGSAVRNLGAMAMAWTSFTININYVSSVLPDSAIIILSASGAGGATPANNSYLYVDDLSFFGGTVGIAENTITINDISIVPNPATNFLNVNYVSKNESEVLIDLIDVTGKSVIEPIRNSSHTGNNVIQIETTKLSKGIYFLNLKSGDLVKTKKVVIQ